ncbi:hypothetical protein ES703_49686 [subsurface metagenome]
MGRNWEFLKIKIGGWDLGRKTAHIWGGEWGDSLLELEKQAGPLLEPAFQIILIDEEIRVESMLKNYSAKSFFEIQIVPEFGIIFL